jgi:hypothetical protein
MLFEIPILLGEITPPVWNRKGQLQDRSYDRRWKGGQGDPQTKPDEPMNPEVFVLGPNI